MKKMWISSLVAVLVAVSGAVAQDKHPLEDYFKAEILTEKAMKEVLVELEILHGQTPTPIRAEVYHTDLEKKVIGLKVELENPELDLKLEMIIQLDALPYKIAYGDEDLIRADDFRGENVKFTVTEIRYEELPDIDDMITEAKEEEEEEESE